MGGIVGQKQFDQAKSMAYVQTRSAWENFLKKHNLYDEQELSSDQGVTVSMSKGRYWLETCGDHTAVNMAILGGFLDDEAVQNPGAPASWLPRKPDLLMLYFCDPRDDAELENVRSVPETTLNNEIPQYYPLAMREVFGVDCVYVENLDFDAIKNYISQGYSVQIATINPGHFVGAYDYDSTNDNLIICDPWPDHIANGEWWKVPYSRTDVQGNVAPWGIVYRGRF